MSTPPLSFGSYPTPIERFDDLGLWVKRDDLVSSVYGGNKVRKLEHHLAAARAAGKKRILTIGAAGSHQVLATALFGKREGFAVEAVLVPQPHLDRAERNLRAALACGLEPIVAPSWAAAPPMALAHMRRDTYFVPLGGSDATGSLGFVEAAREVASQVASGALPTPDVVVVAMGSGGTAAGLAVGFEAAGLRTRVVGVTISPPAAVLAAMARSVAKRTAELVGLTRTQRARAIARIEVDRRWIGKGYARPTPEGNAATMRAESAGLVLDPTYTAKAFACALDRARSENVLYWHTLGARPLEPALEDAPALPRALAGLFRA
jgi:1-aminocyclopropane-1-carboxylate deaminase/D-cysteine desulfhydrase-like pyridoxal-dependent ACC family enzyme